MTCRRYDGGPSARNTLPLAVQCAGSRPPTRDMIGIDRRPVTFSRNSVSVASNTVRWMFSCVASYRSSRYGSAASRRPRCLGTRWPSTNSAMPSRYPPSVRSSPPHVTSSATSRCAVGFGRPVRADSCASVSSTSVAPNASSSRSPRASTDFGGGPSHHGDHVTEGARPPAAAPSSAPTDATSAAQLGVAGHPPRGDAEELRRLRQSIRPRSSPGCGPGPYGLGERVLERPVLAVVHHQEQHRHLVPRGGPQPLQAEHRAAVAQHGDHRPVLRQPGADGRADAPAEAAADGVHERARPVEPQQRPQQDADGDGLVDHDGVLRQPAGDGLGRDLRIERDVHAPTRFLLRRRSRNSTFRAHHRLVDAANRLVDSANRSSPANWLVDPANWLVDAADRLVDSANSLVVSADWLVDAADRFVDAADWLVDAADRLVDSATGWLTPLTMPVSSSSAASDARMPPVRPSVDGEVAAQLARVVVELHDPGARRDGRAGRVVVRGERVACRRPAPRRAR